MKYGKLVLGDDENYTRILLDGTHLIFNKAFQYYHVYLIVESHTG